MGIFAVSVGMIQSLPAVPRNVGEGFPPGGGVLPGLCMHMVMRQIPARAGVRAGSELARVQP